jgi:hypothetical protein
MVSSIELTNLLRHTRNWLAGIHPKNEKVEWLPKVCRSQKNAMERSWMYSALKLSKN